MELVLKIEHHDTTILLERRQIQLRFLERELYLKVYQMAPEYFEVLETKKEFKNARKWSDIFEETPMFKIYKK